MIECVVRLDIGFIFNVVDFKVDMVEYRIVR